MKPPHVVVFDGVRLFRFGKGVGEGPPANMFGEGPLEKRCFGRGDAGEVTEDGGEAPRAEELGEGNANVDIDGACRKLEKSCENAPKLIGCIFSGT